MITRWDSAVAVDLREFYQIDVYDGITRDRPWWWLTAHIRGLLDRPTSRLANIIEREAT